MTVLLTRPEAQSHETATLLAADGVTSLIWPLTRINPVDAPRDTPAGTTALLFTSANAVRAWAALSLERQLPALCVGPRTAKTAAEAGWDAEAAGGCAEALADLVRSRGHRFLFHPRGRHVAGDLASGLGASGILLVERVVYEAVETGGPTPEIDAALACGKVRVLSAWSPRGAEILARAMADRPDWPAARMRLVAISAAAAAPLRVSGLRAVQIAEIPDGRAMCAAILLAARG
ncbi:MAG: uroporphyrinogen-III synthase [Pseudomonadota bacterium]